MPWNTVSDFMTSAKQSKLIPAELWAVLVDEDVHTWGYSQLASLEPLSSHWNAYQRQCLLQERPHDLLIAGYAILGELGPCPGGHEYLALHPQTGREVALRRLSAGWVGDGPSRERLLLDAHKVMAMAHPHLVTVVDAVASDFGTVVVALEKFDGGDLETLTSDIGPMPYPLAATYTLSAGKALQYAHEHGLIHGDVHPRQWYVGPLVATSKLRADGTPKQRPTSASSFKLFGLGFTSTTFGETRDKSADIQGLAASLTFLLTAKHPTSRKDVEELRRLRPDVPTAILPVLASAFASDARDKPTLQEFHAALTETLTPYEVKEKPTAVPSQAESLEDLVDAALNSASDVHAPRRSEAVFVLPVDDVKSIAGSLDGFSLPDLQSWPSHSTSDGTASPVELQPFEYVPQAYAPHDMEDDHPEALPHDDSPVKRRVPAEDAQETRRKIRMWILLGAGLWVFAFLLWGVYFFQPFSGSSKPAPNPKKTR